MDKNVIINTTTACSNSNSNDDGEAANDKDNDNSTEWEILLKDLTCTGEFIVSCRNHSRLRSCPGYTGYSYHDNNGAAI